MLPRIIFISSFFISITLHAQTDTKGTSVRSKPFGIKGGLNTTAMSWPRSFRGSGNMGFFFGGYYAPRTSSRFGVRSELLFSRQSYDYANNQKTGSVKLDYLMLPQLFTANFSRYVQLQAGPQLAVLLRGKADSATGAPSAPAPAQPTDVFSRFHFGYAAGVESNPVGGLSFGVRYNFFLNLLQDQSVRPSNPSYIPDYNGKLKYGTWQVSVGYRF